MNEKQRTALKELADVMEKHDIILWSFHDTGIIPVIGDDHFGFGDQGSEFAGCVIRGILSEQSTDEG